MTKRVAKRILLVWAIALGIAVPLPILLTKDRSNLFVDDFCAINIPEFAIYGSLVAFFLPLVVMFVTYSLTIRTLQKQSQLVSHMMGSSLKKGMSTSSSISSRMSGKRNSEKSYSEYSDTPDPMRKKQTSDSQYRRIAEDAKIEEERMLTRPNKKKITISKSSSTGSSVLLSYDGRSKRSRIKQCAVLCCAPFRCSDYEPPKNNASKQDPDSDFLTVSRVTTSKMDSESSDSSNDQPVKRSPLLTRANMKLAKAVSKLPLKRGSTRGMSVSMKSRAIASEKRASKVLGMVFTMFCIFWCPFFITNVMSRLCESCDQALMGELMNWFVWVGYVSSGVNPCLYTLFSRRFRDTFRKLLLRQYDSIGHKSLHRGYHSGAPGRSSVRYHTAFQNSMDSSASQTSRGSFRPVGGASQRKFGENVMIRQHRRSQYTRNAPESEGLPVVGGISEKRLNISADGDLAYDSHGDFQCKIQNTRVQWRTTWPAASDNESKITDRTANGGKPVNENIEVLQELRQKATRPKRITSDPTSTRRKSPSERQSSCHDRRIMSKDSKFQSSPKCTNTETCTNASNNRPDTEKVVRSEDEEESSSFPVRSSENQGFCSSEDRLASCSEESLYDNNPQDVFLESEEKSNFIVSVNFNRSKSLQSEATESTPKKRERFFSEGHSQFCQHCAVQYDKLDPGSYHRLGRIAEKTSHNFTGNEYGAKTTKLNNETSTRAQTELSRLDSGIGESLRNSESY